MNEENKSKILLPSEPEGTFPDKPGPTTPPQPLIRKTPEWAKPIVEVITQVVNDEGLVLDLCMERCVDMVEFHHNKGLVGIDLFSENGGSVPRVALISVAAPLAVELYKQVVASLNGPCQEKFNAAVKEALEKKQAG